MQLSISGHHLTVTEPLRDYVTEKLQKLERHYDHITNTHVVLSVEKLQHRAEATIHISGAELFAESDCDDLYAAIDKSSSTRKSWWTDTTNAPAERSAASAQQWISAPS